MVSSAIPSVRLLCCYMPPKRTWLAFVFEILFQPSPQTQVNMPNTESSCSRFDVIYHSKALHNKYIIYLSKSWPNGLARSPKKPKAKLVLRRTMGWLASTRRSQKNNSKTTDPVFHWIISCYNNERCPSTSIDLGHYFGQTVKNLYQLAYKFHLYHSEHQSSQVNARPNQTESQVDSSFQFASTCDAIWPWI